MTRFRLDSEPSDPSKEASQMAQALIDAGIPAERIIQESQATTTAENAWFLLRWIPKGTGKLFLGRSSAKINK